MPHRTQHASWSSGAACTWPVCALTPALLLLRSTQWAECATPLTLLQEKDADGYLVDLCVLHIRGSVRLEPPFFMGAREEYKLLEIHHELHPVGPDATEMQSAGCDGPGTPNRALPAPMPRPARLRWEPTHYLRLGDPSRVGTGDPLTVAGWPTPHGQRTIYVDNGHSCLSREHGHVKSQAFLHDAMSGGPICVPSPREGSLELVAVSSMSRSPRYPSLDEASQLNEPHKYAGWGRTVDFLTPRHWGSGEPRVHVTHTVTL